MSSTRLRGKSGASRSLNPPAPSAASLFVPTLPRLVPPARRGYSAPPATRSRSRAPRAVASAPLAAAPLAPLRSAPSASAARTASRAASSPPRASAAAGATAPASPPPPSATWPLQAPTRAQAQPHLSHVPLGSTPRAQGRALAARVRRASSRTTPAPLRASLPPPAHTRQLAVARLFLALAARTAAWAARETPPTAHRRPAATLPPRVPHTHSNHRGSQTL